MRSQRRSDDVILHVRGNDDALDQVLGLNDFFPAHHAFDVRLVAGGRAVEDLRQLVFVRVPHHQLVEETVHLRFGQRIGALLLDRILSGHHEERLFQLVGGIADRNAVLLHGLEHGRLRLGRGPVDFVRQNQLREDRASLEFELARAGGFVFDDHLGADDVRRHEVGRKLDAAEVEAQRFAQRADQVGLAQPRHALDQRVPADEQAGQHAFDDVLVPDDGLLYFAANVVELLAKLLGEFLNRWINLRSHALLPFNRFSKHVLRTFLPNSPVAVSVSADVGRP